MGAERDGGTPPGRLTRSAQFQRLRRGKRFTAEFGRLQGIARARDEAVPFALRFGLIVPKKLGTAPQRNRIKRRLREGLRLAQRSGCFEAEGGGRSTATVGLDIGIFPSSAVLAMNFDALMVQLCSGVAELMRKRGRLPI
jgi:ribonuclease P protein component